MKKNNTRAAEFSVSSATGATANNSDTNKITATLLNNGAPVPNIDVTFVVITEGASFSDGSKNIIAKTDAQGVCAVLLKSEVAGNIEVDAVCYFSEFLHGGTESVFEDVPAGQNTLTATVLGDATATADGTDSVTIVYTLKNGAAPVAGEYIFVNVSGSAVAQPPSLKTDAWGTASVNITNTVAEDVTVMASAALLGVEAKPVQLSFEAVVLPYTITGAVIANNAAADGESTNTVLFKVTDTATGNPAANQVLDCIASYELSLDGGQYHNTDINGEVAVTCSTLVPADDYSIKAVLYTNSSVSYTVDGIAFAKPEHIKDLIGLVNIDNVEADPYGDGSYCEIIYSLTKARALDGLEGYSIYITADSSSIKVSEKTLTTDENGRASLRIYGAIAETVTITATTDIEGIYDESVVHFRQPVAVTSGVITDAGVYSLDTFSHGQYKFLADHAYQLKLTASIAGDVQQATCQAGFNITSGLQACQMIDDPRYAQFDNFNYDGAMTKCIHGGTETATNIYYVVAEAGENGEMPKLVYTLVIMDFGVN